MCALRVYYMLYCVIFCVLYYVYRTCMVRVCYVYATSSSATTYLRVDQPAVGERNVEQVKRGELLSKFEPRDARGRAKLDVNVEAVL